MLPVSQLFTISITTIFLWLSFPAWAGQQATANPEYTAFVTIKLKDAQQQDWTAIEKHLSTFTDLELDFVCHESGIMVWRVVHTTLSDVADIHILVRNLLSPVLDVGAYSILDIHLALSPAEGNC